MYCLLFVTPCPHLTANTEAIVRVQTVVRKASSRQHAPASPGADGDSQAVDVHSSSTSGVHALEAQPNRDGSDIKQMHAPVPRASSVDISARGDEAAAAQPLASSVPRDAGQASHDVAPPKSIADMSPQRPEEGAAAPLHRASSQREEDDTLQLLHYLRLDRRPSNAHEQMLTASGYSESTQQATSRQMHAGTAAGSSTACQSPHATRSEAPCAQFTSDITNMSDFTEEMPRTLDATDAKEQLLCALDNMAGERPQEPFAGRYILLRERVEGGQAVVNFARDEQGGFFQYAIKCAPNSRRQALA